jgi:hypothetical protein
MLCAASNCGGTDATPAQSAYQARSVTFFTPAERHLLNELVAEVIEQRFTARTSCVLPDDSHAHLLTQMDCHPTPGIEACHDRPPM